MEVFWFAGVLILFIIYCLRPQLLRFDLKTYLHFVKWMLFASTISIGIRLLIGSFPPLPPTGFGSLLLVGWEDLLFSLTLIYLPFHYLNRKIAIPLAIISSILFASGHVNQGYLWAFITLFYPYFISYKLAKSKGYGTVMTLHMTYDIIVVSTIHLLHYLGKYV